MYHLELYVNLAMFNLPKTSREPLKNHPGNVTIVSVFHYPGNNTN